MARKKPKRIRQTSNKIYTIAICMVLALGLFGYSKQRDYTPLAVATPIAPREQTDPDFTFLPVPTRDIAVGEQLSTIDLSQVRWPITPTTPRFVTNKSELQGHASSTILPSGVPILRESLSSETTDINAVVEGIPPGMRAITVRVDIESAVEGWARSGNYVDVIVLRPSASPDTGLEAKVIAENVRILSAGRSVAPVNKDQSGSQTPGTVTLLVSQQDALRIKTGSSIGRLTFSLRGHGDSSPTLNRSLNQRDLLFGSDTIKIKEARYLGTAKGPDGQSYVLTEDAKWLRATEQAARLNSEELTE